MTDPRRQSLDELAAGAIDDFDVDLLRQTARVFDTLDPMSDSLVERINFGLTLDALHAEVAELQRNADLVGVRADIDADVQTVTFTSSALTTMITVTPTSGDRVRIDGWIAPGAEMTVELRVRTDMISTRSDESGRFVFEDVSRGLAQLILRADGSDGHTVVTPAIEI